MAEFETLVTTHQKGTIHSYSVAKIIDMELKRLLGGNDRFIEDGVIRESDYRFNGSDKIREATDEEIELFKALNLVKNHFRSLK